MVSMKLTAALLACTTIVVTSQGRPFVTDQASPTAEPPISETLAVGGSSGQLLAQIVTVGVTGRLWEIRVPIGCADGQLVLEIRDVDDEGRPGAVYHSQTFEISELGGGEFLTDELRTLRLRGRPLRFEAGDSFSFVLSNPTGSCGLWPAPEGDVYGGGSAWFIAAPNPPGVWVPLTTSDDLPFETVVHAPGPGR